MLKIGHSPRVFIVDIEVGLKGISLYIFLSVYNIGCQKTGLFADYNSLFSVIKNNISLGRLGLTLCRFKLHKGPKPFDRKSRKRGLENYSLSPVEKEIGFLSDNLAGNFPVPVKEADFGLTGNVMILLGKVKFTFHISLVVIGLEIHYQNGIFAFFGRRLVLGHGKKGLGTGKLGNVKSVIYNPQAVFDTSFGGRAGKNIVKFTI